MLTSPSQAPPISSIDFLDSCHRLISKKDYEDIVRADINPDKTNSKGLAQQYCMWERSLRNNLVRLRATENGLNADDYLRQADQSPETYRIADGAMKQETALESEIFLNNHRWWKIDELSSGHFFDMEYLRGYRLKLLLQERMATFDEERGFLIYKELYERILETSRETQL